ncbi:MAG: tetratricopeptide repeat protein [Anaerobacillus sp.]|uniref:tetratricopeptide repeat protein n=1 Tax=Anaerobacillus sp. TaxID=1872506 RepID=UPI00391D99F5
MLDFNELVFKLKQKNKTEPNNTTIMNELAIALMEVNEYEEALLYFEKAAHIKPSIQSLHNLGYFYYTEGVPLGDGIWEYREDKALEILKKTIELEPVSHYPYTLLGEIYSVKGEYTKAIELLKKSISFQPTLENLNNLGVCLYHTCEIKDATNYFRLASLERGNGNNSLHPLLSYGYCLAKLGKHAEARLIVNDLITLSKEPDSDIEREQIADIFYETNDFVEVVKIYADTMFEYASYWVPLYMYSLNQIGDKYKMKKVLDDVLLKTEEKIEETLNDDDVDWDYKDKMKYIDELRDELSFYKNSYKEILVGKRPALEYLPSIERNCYLFGCTRHNNPNCNE